MCACIQKYLCIHTHIYIEFLETSAVLSTRKKNISVYHAGLALTEINSHIGLEMLNLNLPICIGVMDRIKCVKSYLCESDYRN